jgi:hypothetical protein
MQFQIREEIRGILVAFEDEKKSQNLSRSRLKAEENKLLELKEKVRQERQTILAAISKMASAESKIESKIKALEGFAQVCNFSKQKDFITASGASVFN